MGTAHSKSKLLGSTAKKVAARSVVAKALVEATGKSPQQVKEFLKTKTWAQKIALRNSPELRPIIERLEAEKARARVPSIPLDMPGRYHTSDVLSVSGWSRMKLHRRIQQGKFPKPQKDGELNYWSTAVVREALGL
jgi:hypothetical protein